MAKTKAKTAGGTKVDVRVTKAISKGPVIRDAEQQAEHDKRMAAMRAKRQSKSALTKTQTGFENLGAATEDKDLEWLVGWLKDPVRKGMTSFLCSAARNGFLEQAFEKKSAQSNVPEVLGRRIVSRPGLKWRALGARESAWILARLLENDLIEGWFTGPGRLDGEIARKGLRNVLGVEESTNLPGGHEHACYEYPFLWLCVQRWKELGCRGRGVTKENIDDMTDYFQLVADPPRVLANFIINKDGAARPVEIRVTDLAVAQDWCILHGDCYHKATLISDTEGDDHRLARKSERLWGTVVFDAVFNFPPLENQQPIEFQPFLATQQGKNVDEVIQNLRALPAEDIRAVK